MTTIIYARRSSESGDDYSLDTQVLAARQYAAAHGLGDCEVVLENFTGTKHLREREHGSKLWTEIQAGRVSGLIVYCIDRLSRAKLRHALTLIDEILDSGVSLHSADVGQITNTDDIGLIIRSWQAGEERKKIVDRMMRGKYGKARSGKWVGSGPAPYGFRRVGRLTEAHLEQDPERSDVVRWLVGRYLGNDGPPVAILGLRDELWRRGIKSPLGQSVWRVSTIARVLSSPAMIGQFDYGSESVVLDDLAIVSRAEWLAVQATMQINRERAPRNRKRDYLLAGGRLLCSCGRSMYAVGVMSRGKPYFYYTCNQANEHRAARTCVVHRLKMEPIDTVVWAWVLAHISDERLRDGIERLRKHERDRAGDRERLTGIEAESKQLRARITELMRQFGESNKPAIVEAREAAIEEAADKLTALDAERSSLMDAIDHADARLAARLTLAERVRGLRAKLESMTVGQQAQLLDIIGLRVTLVERSPLRVRIDSEIAPPEVVGVC